jgi:outer membrane lipoprotein-sorting protein
MGVTLSVSELSRKTMSAYETLAGFAATQTITAGSISAEARVRFRKPNKITAEYRSYKNPLAEFEEELAGGAEFVAQELIGMHLVYDGQGTWLHDAKNDVATCKLGRALYAPFPETSVLAEIGFLGSLTRDFLLRDEGEETCAGRSAHCLGLRPKVQYRSYLLKQEVFPIKEASLTIDKETFFPLKIVFTPIHPSTLSYLLGSSIAITIEYTDLRLEPPEEKMFSFTPAQGTRVFREEIVSREALNETLPFHLPLSELEAQAKVQLYGDRATVTINEEKDRAYAFFTFVPAEGAGSIEADSYALSLWVGNYLSLNMNRRRATLSERGERIPLEGVSARLVDRGKMLKEKVPQAPERSILEIGWENRGVFWFILAENLEGDRLVEIAKILARSEAKG